MRTEQDDFVLEQRVRFGTLFDLYASILTERQRLSCELLLRDDLSISELAAELGTTRQGAHDLVRRSREHLEYIEANLHLLALRNKLDDIGQLIEAHRDELPPRFLEAIRRVEEAKEEPVDV